MQLPVPITEHPIKENLSNYHHLPATKCVQTSQIYYLHYTLALHLTTTTTLHYILAHH